jgi:hypothetical protein
MNTGVVNSIINVYQETIADPHADILSFVVNLQKQGHFVAPGYLTWYGRDKEEIETNVGVISKFNILCDDFVVVALEISHYDAQIYQFVLIDVIEAGEPQYAIIEEAIAYNANSAVAEYYENLRRTAALSKFRQSTLIISGQELLD